MFKNIILWSLGIISALFLIFIFYMLFIVKAGAPDLSKDNSIMISGKVDSVYEGGVKDLVFKLKGSETTYYINRGLEHSFDLDEANALFINKDITLWHSKRRSGEGGHVMQLKFQDSIYYTEWKIPLASKN